MPLPVKPLLEFPPHGITCEGVSIGPEEIEAAGRVLRSGRLGGNGPASWALEEALRERLGVPCALVTSSGTHALEMALMALQIQPGDEVIVPSFTFVSTANAVVRMKATPVFVDIDPSSLTIDCAHLREKISSRTKAIVPVHYAGFPCDMETLLAISRERGIPLVEDAAHALGCRFQGRNLGTWGQCGVLSFHETKGVSCGEGGAFLTSDPDLARRADWIREKGTNRTDFLQGRVDRYEWHSEGSSFVLSDLLAAVGLAQLNRMEALMERRRAIGLRYLEALGPLEAKGLVRIVLPRLMEDWNWYLFILLFPSAQERRRVETALQDSGVPATRHFPALHLSPYARTHYGYRPGDLPVTERVSETLLRLPLHPSLSEEAIEFIATMSPRAIA